jgi:hypothetical protein
VARSRLAWGLALTVRRAMGVPSELHLRPTYLCCIQHTQAGGRHRYGSAPFLQQAATHRTDRSQEQYVQHCMHKQVQANNMCGSIVNVCKSTSSLQACTPNPPTAGYRHVPSLDRSRRATAYSESLSVTLLSWRPASPTAVPTKP